MKKFLVLLLSINFSVHGKQNGNSPAIMEGNSVTSKIKESIVTIKGNVKITQQDSYSITANSATFDKNNKKIYLDGEIRMLDRENNSSIFAKKAELSDDFRSGTFDDVGFTMEGGISILSERMTKENDGNYLGYNSEYYFCPAEDLDINSSHENIIKQLRENKIQWFSIYSKKSHVDKNRKKTYMENAYIRFLNIPFFYTPYMYTSKRLDDRASGPAIPHISRHGRYGYGFHFPIDLYLFDNLNIFLEPIIYQKGNFLGKTTINYRKSGKLYINLMYSYAYDRGQSKHIKNNSGVDEETERKYKNSRNFFNFKSGAILGNEIHLKTDINYALDPYLLRDYFYDYRETLQSNLNVFKIYDYSHINFDLLAFQQIGERNNAGVSETPLFVPLVEYDYSSRNLVEHGNFRLNLHSRILDSYSAYNKKYAKVNFDTAAVYSNLFSGLYANASLAMYSDIYYKLDVYTEENRKYRFYPELEIKLLYPVFLFEKIEVIPILQYFTSEKRNLNLTNLDSKNSELTMNNLFSRNRYGGYDLVETGDRVNYGLKVNLPTGIGQFSLNIGQGYRNFIDNKHRIDFFSKEFSYLLTMFGYRYSNLSLNYMNHIDNTAHRIDRGDLIVSFNHSRFSFNISHVYVSNRISTTGNDEERLSLNLMFAVTKKFYSSLEIGGDLVHKNLTGVKVAFGYEDNCYRTELIIDKQDFMDPSSRNSVPSFRFRFGVKN